MNARKAERAANPGAPDLYDVFIGTKVDGQPIDLAKLIVPSNRQGLKLDVLPSTEQLHSIDVSLVQMGILHGLAKGYETAGNPLSPDERGDFAAYLAKDIYSHLGDALEPLRHLYDIIFLDCPPGYGIQTNSALLASDSVLITMDSSYWSFQAGANATNYFVDELKSIFAKDIVVAGIILCRFQARLLAHQQVATWLEEAVPDLLFSTRIRESTNFSKMTYASRSLWEAKGKLRDLAADYEIFAQELMERIQRSTRTP